MVPELKTNLQISEKSSNFAQWKKHIDYEKTISTLACHAHADGMQ